MAENLRLSPAQLETIIGHARDCRPEEACGVLAGDSEGRVIKVFLMENAEHSEVFYQMDSEEQFQVFDEMEREALDLVAIFHSHPHPPAFPSERDRELAFYPDAVYLIVSLMKSEPECHAFRIEEGNTREIDIFMED